MAQEILKGLGKPLANIITFGIQKSKTEKDNTVVKEIKEKIDSIDLQKPVTQEQLVESIFDILETGAALTDTKADDKLVKTFKRIYKLYTGVKPAGELIERIKERIKERRKARKQRKAERNS